MWLLQSYLNEDVVQYIRDISHPLRNPNYTPFVLSCLSDEILFARLLVNTRGEEPDPGIDTGLDETRNDF
jgi:hypothetical protein